MAESISKLIIDYNGKEYEFAGGGGTPGPNTVGTEQIIDDSVEMEDLNEDVKKNMTHTYDAENEGIKLGGLSGNR
jgi:hypothetical protein